MLLDKSQMLMSANGGLRDEASGLKHLLAMSTLEPAAKNISITVSTSWALVMASSILITVAQPFSEHIKTNAGCNFSVTKFQ